MHAFGMGLLTFGASATLVILQTTTILLDRNESAWSLNLVHMSPDTSEWRPALERILASPSPTSSSSSSLTNRSRGGSALLVAKSAGPLLCLQAIIEAAASGNASSGDSGNNSSSGAELRARMAYGCLLHARAPRAPTEVLDAFNPHLVLLALCCMQLLVALARVDYAREHRDNPASVMVVALHIPLYAAAVFLLLLFIAACAVQAVHDPELLRYPTLCIAALYILIGTVYAATTGTDSCGKVDSKEAATAALSWELAFHLQTVAVPTAVLAFAVYGTRQWTDLFCYLLLLSVAVNLLWLQLQEDAPVFLARLLILGLLAVVLWSVHTSFGAFDDWRYVAAFIASVGLAPLLLLSLTPAAASSAPEDASAGAGAGFAEWCSLGAYTDLSLTASNAALLSLCVSQSALL